MQNQVTNIYHQATLNQPAHYASSTGRMKAYTKADYYQRPTQFFDEYAYRPIPSTSTSVMIHNNTRQFNPNLGSNEYYTEYYTELDLKGVKVVRSLNNIFIPQIAP
jgi:hypothetical protein